MITNDYLYYLDTLYTRHKWLFFPYIAGTALVHTSPALKLWIPHDEAIVNYVDVDSSASV